MNNTKIEWAYNTNNLWIGCSEVHSGCDNCYARAISQRFKMAEWGNKSMRKAAVNAFKTLDTLQRKLANKGIKETVFMGSMMDIFEKPIQINNPYVIDELRMYDTGMLRDELFKRITLGKYENIIFLFLTKRVSNINKYIPVSWRYSPPRNVMFGVSVSDQKTFNSLVPQLALKVNGYKFLSIEPQLGDIDISSAERIHWIIQGGESGSKKRRFNVDWANSMRIQCARLGIPYFFKQIDKVQEIPEQLLIRQFPKFFNLNHE